MSPETAVSSNPAALSDAEKDLVGQWCASQGKVSAAYRANWNGAPAFVAILRSGVGLVRADDTGAASFRRTGFTLSSPDAATRVMTAARDVEAAAEPVSQTLVFAASTDAAAFDRAWQSGLAAGASVRDELDRSVSFLETFSGLLLGLGVLVAVLGIAGSVALFAHTGLSRDRYGHLSRVHDLVGFGLAGLLSTAVTAALLIGVGAIGRVVALRHRANAATGAD